MNTIFQGIQSFQEFLWGVPMLAALMGTHLYFTLRLGFIQKKIPMGIRLSISNQGHGEGNLSPFSALATSLAATIGTGNIIGISTAIAIGGPGAAFWCWLTGVLGVATCYAESFLAVKYRVKRADGTYAGGPMYVLDHVLHQISAAVAFSVAAILASFGIGGAVQANSIVTSVRELTSGAELCQDSRCIGLIIAFLTALVILGGTRQIAKICTWLVPFMSVFYFAGCMALIWMNRDVLGETFLVILKNAFGGDFAVGRSIFGGAVGGTMMTAMRTGISRGLFTNEAGLGSIPMTAASTSTSSPHQQGLISMTGPFWDTVVMCALTGIAVVGSMVKTPDAFANVSGDQLCFVAFSALPAFGRQLLSISLILFAFATIVGWNYYGECAVNYLGNASAVKWYRICYICMVYIGAVSSLEMVWAATDLCDAWMMIPNLLCLWKLRKEISG